MRGLEQEKEVRRVGGEEREEDDGVEEEEVLVGWGKGVQGVEYGVERTGTWAGRG